MEELISAKEAAKTLNCHYITLMKNKNNLNHSYSKIPFYPVKGNEHGNPRYKYRMSDIKAYLEHIKQNASI